MATQQRFRNQQRRAPNRSWAGAFEATTTVVAAGAKSLMGSFALSNTNIDETILRVVGVLSVASDQAAAAEQQAGAWGMILVTDAALAIGITVIPGPISDSSDDGWFVYQPFWQTTGLLGPGISSIQYPFDSRAKRVVNEGTSMAIVAENGHGTHGLVLGYTLRLLSMVRGT